MRGRGVAFFHHKTDQNCIVQYLCEKCTQESCNSTLIRSDFQGTGCDRNGMKFKPYSEFLGWVYMYVVARKAL